MIDPATDTEVEGQMTQGTIDYESGSVSIKITDLEVNSQTAANYAYNNMSINIPVAHDGNVMRKNQLMNKFSTLNYSNKRYNNAVA